MVRLIVGFCAGMAAFAFGISMQGGRPESLFHLASALIVVGGACGAMLMAYPVSSWQRSFSAAFGNKPKGTTEAAQFFRAFSKAFLVAGLIGFTVGVVHTFQNWGAAETNAMGFMTALVAPLEALILKLFIADAGYNRCNMHGEAKGGSHRRAA